MVKAADADEGGRSRISHGDPARSALEDERADRAIDLAPTQRSVLNWPTRFSEH
jgi:hypothetical protein